MSILIKGMDMPKDGFVDVRLFADGTSTTQTGESPFYKELDVVEVPTPHGRLTDIDRLQTVFERNTGYDYPDIFDNAPIVIEAEE